MEYNIHFPLFIDMQKLLAIYGNVVVTVLGVSTKLVYAEPG